MLVLLLSLRPDRQTFTHRTRIAFPQFLSSALQAIVANLSSATITMRSYIQHLDKSLCVLLSLSDDAANASDDMFSTSCSAYPLASHPLTIASRHDGPNTAKVHVDANPIWAVPYRKRHGFVVLLWFRWWFGLIQVMHGIVSQLNLRKHLFWMRPCPAKRSDLSAQITLSRIDFIQYN